jgi:hypothetical protein
MKSNLLNYKNFIKTYSLNQHFLPCVIKLNKQKAKTNREEKKH